MPAASCLRASTTALDANEFPPPRAIAARRPLGGWLSLATRSAEAARLDKGVPGSALDVWELLRARHADVPTVMLTADRDGELRQRLQDVGIGVLYKPLKPLALRQVLQRVGVGVARV